MYKVNGGVNQRVDCFNDEAVSLHNRWEKPNSQSDLQHFRTFHSYIFWIFQIFEYTIVILKMISGTWFNQPIGRDNLISIF
jgi:hypothetical protein